MIPHKRIGFIGHLMGLAMAGQLAGVAAEVGGAEISPAVVEHRDHARNRRISLRDSSAPIAKAKRAKSRL